MKMIFEAKGKIVAVTEQTAEVNKSSSVAIATEEAAEGAALAVGYATAALSMAERSVACAMGAYSAALTMNRESVAECHTLGSVALAVGEDSLAVTETAAVAAALGINSRAEGRWPGAVALAGRSGRVCGVEGAVIALIKYEGDRPVGIVSAVVGSDGIEPGVWYALNKYGQFKPV